MFYVKEKKNNGNKEIPQVKTVYGVQYKHGYPFFTFYENEQWITRSAKHYMPADQ